MSSSGRQTPTRPSIRETIAARRAELRKTPKSQRTGDLQTYGSPAGRKGGTPRGFVHLDGNGMDLIDDKTLEGQLKRAVKSGKLDISHMELESMPPKVYTTLLGLSLADLSNPPPPPPPKISAPKVRPSTSPFALDDGLEKDDVFGKTSESEEAWTEPEELTAFRAGHNKLTAVEREIGMFGGLKILDLSNNLLKAVPDKLSDLLRLTSLDLSHNSLSAVPRAVLVLPQLQVLDLSHNSLSSISFADPIGPSEEGMGYGSGFFTTAIQRATSLKAKRPVLPALHHLNLGNNRLTAEGISELASVALRGVRVLNLEKNDLRGILDVESVGMDASRMPELSQLVLSGNTTLRGIKGDLASSAKAETIGCGIQQFKSSGFSRDTTPAAENGTSTDTASAAIDPIPTETEEPSLPVPEPDCTFVYRTLPAASFDSEPLGVDFDLYLPSAPACPAGHPLVIWFHGGGLLQGNKENLPPHFRRLPSHTYPGGSDRPDASVAVISPNYRLSPQVPIIDILSDVNSLLDYVRDKLNPRLEKEGRSEHKIDTSRICLSGGSAGGYLALIAGLKVPNRLNDEEVGGYRGWNGEGIKCLAPFYPITDLTDKFWATETNPVPWMDGKSISHADAKPHIDTKATPVCTAVSGGPRSILYPYMLQHSLFPSLLFRTQRAVGSGSSTFHPSPLALSIPYRLGISASSGKSSTHVPIYFVYGTIDDKVQPMDMTLEAFKGSEGKFTVQRVEGGDHAFDEDAKVECEEFREWLGKTLL